MMSSSEIEERKPALKEGMDTVLCEKKRYSVYYLSVDRNLKTFRIRIWSDCFAPDFRQIRTPLHLTSVNASAKINKQRMKRKKAAQQHAVLQRQGFHQSLVNARLW